MNTWIRCFVVGILLSGLGLAGPAEGASKRVLFLGNSVFYYDGGVFQTFEGFCAADGLDYQAFSQWKQPENAHGIEFFELGRIPLNLPEVAAKEAIHSLIRSGDFDYVILEARRPGYLVPDWVERDAELDRGDSLPYEENLEALEKLYRTIVGSGAETVLYMHPGFHELRDWKLPLAQLYGRMQRDLESMEIEGKRHDVMLVPASFLWLDALNRFDLETWYANPGHGTALARYASGCMLYAYLTGKDPRRNGFRELPRAWDVSADVRAEYVSEQDAEWIKNQSWFYYSTR